MARTAITTGQAGGSAQFARRLLLTLCCSLLLACEGPGHVPVVERAQPPTEKINHHWVARGETLYAIAWRYNLDPVALAASNRIAAPYQLKVGQKLSLLTHTRAAGEATRTAAPAGNAVRSVTRQPAIASTVAGNWRWPADGKLVTRYSAAGNRAHSGLDIAGRTGQPVRAANDGVVVYAGTGLPAYGKLLIVKHDQQYLSAYAHNSRLLVAEGERVRGGQQIAELGSTGAQFAHLHFELRRNGRPVDPLTLLPKV